MLATQLPFNGSEVRDHNPSPICDALPRVCLQPHRPHLLPPFPLRVRHPDLDCLPSTLIAEPFAQPQAPQETEEDLCALRAKVCAGVWDSQPQDRSEGALDLVTGMLQVDTDSRLTLDDVCDHAWVGGQDKIPWRGANERL
mmetsp:Transcript_44896/g.89674  ORF Transcript_44896/g.89674 Transcript_44896/m.89674 type:complete len:141 (+) Transcript_44896:788-1210(+)